VFGGLEEMRKFINYVGVVIPESELRRNIAKRYEERKHRHYTIPIELYRDNINNVLNDEKE
jgi:replication fork clamp-binding protein CrfC